MQHVVIKCGLPFAGKSTLARVLARRFGWTYLEVDAVHREQGRSADTITRQEWIEAYREGFRRLDTALAADASVVYDATNYRRVQRAQLRRIAARHGSAVMLVHVATAEAEARQRWQGNRRVPRRADVPDADFTLVAEGFQPPARTSPTCATTAACRSTPGCDGRLRSPAGPTLPPICLWNTM